MSKFIYLLNAMEAAAQADKPAEHGYASKRKAVLEYVEKLESAREYVNGDASRIDFLAEITNLSALLDFGALLTSEQKQKIDKTAEALSDRYEFHRRTHDTPTAFRKAVDDARGISKSET